MIGCTRFWLLPYIKPWSKSSNICDSRKIITFQTVEGKDLDVSSLCRQLLLETLLSSKDLGLVFDGSYLKSYLWLTVTSFRHSCCKFIIFVSDWLFYLTFDSQLWRFLFVYSCILMMDNSWKILTANVLHVGQKVRNHIVIESYPLITLLLDASQISLFSTINSQGYTYRCDVRLFTYLPTFPANMTVTLLLILRVLALCESITVFVCKLFIHYFQMKTLK